MCIRDRYTTVQQKLDSQEENKLDNEFQDFKDELKNDLPQLDNDDLIDLMEGKFVKGYKLTKAQRRDIKHAIRRGEVVDFKKILKIKDEQVEFGFKGISPIYNDRYEKKQEFEADIVKKNNK
eukprot:TRINITY_DN548_c0_g1_i3.p3 TRINITY_DN548_c0_g1~~TRINITY_DN548_c0_g1_i3.p3  ORF type:complete len:122 (+),score=44.87 TRINITY_DN548_c0_g1_i3:185-550(+)